MKYGCYNFKCTFEADAVLPVYKGSIFRGMFGKALKDVICVLRTQKCIECLLQKTCAYVNIFETQLLPSKTKFSPCPPHPFVLEPPLETKTNYKKGDTFEFTLKIFGEHNQKLPYFIYTIKQIGEFGIGRKLEKEMGKFRIDAVYKNDILIYENSTRILNSNPEVQELYIDTKDFASLNSMPNSLELILITPLRVKYRNKLVDNLEFHILVRAMLRRVADLFGHFDTTEPYLDFKSLIKLAEEVSIQSSNVTWYDWERHSFRQKKTMKLGGLIGSIVYQGPISDFLPLLNFCEKTHIGKQTTFGLGQFTYRLI